MDYDSSALLQCFPPLDKVYGGLKFAASLGAGGPVGVFAKQSS